MGILSWIVIGVLAGWMAGVNVSRHGYALFTNVLTAVLGAIAAGFLAGALFKLVDPISNINLATVIFALAGAVLTVVFIRIMPAGEDQKL